MDVLHREYATRGRIDSDASVSARREIIVAAPTEVTWRILSDPSQWSRIDPAIHAVRVDGPVAAGTRFTWRNGMARMRSRFAVVQPMTEISWTGLSAGIRAVHRHVLTDVDGRATRLVSEESMAGWLLPLYFGSGKLRATLDAWLAAIKKEAERVAAGRAAE